MWHSTNGSKRNSENKEKKSGEIHDTNHNPNRFECLYTKKGRQYFGDLF